MALFVLLSPIAFGAADLSQIDSIRSELYLIRDKNSPNYIKTKQKLDKAIKRLDFDYSFESRMNDVNRLIQENKYNGAMYELNELIASGYNLSKCYELLGDISFKTNQSPKQTAKFYKESLKEDSDNQSAIYKLFNLYLLNNRNILAIEYLKMLVEKTDDYNLLSELANTINTKINPKSRYEANILYEILGDIYVKQQKKQEFKNAYLKALKLNPDDIYIKYYLANLLYSENEYQAANELFASIIASNPYDLKIRFLKAKALYKLGNYTESEKEYFNILSMFPNSTNAKYEIYKMYENKLPIDKIIKKINKKDPNYVLKQNDYDTFISIAQDMNDYESANKIKVFSALALKPKTQTQPQKTALAPKQKQNNQNKEQILRQKEEQNKIKLEKERQEKQRLEQLKQERLKLEKERQEKLKLEKQRLEQEKLQKQKAQKEKLEKERLEKLAQEEQKKLQEQKKKELEKQKIKQAQDELNEQKLIEKEQKISQQKDPKKYEKISKEIEKYTQTNPKTPQTYLAIANSYKQISMPRSALKYLHIAKKEFPTDSEIYYNLGLSYFELNSFQSAKSNLEKAINLDNENQKAINLLSFVNQNIITQIVNSAYDKYNNKNYIEAFDILDEGIKKYPTNAQLFYYRALVASGMGRNAAAIIDLQKSIKLDATNYMSYYHLGKTYEKIGDERSALVAYERFLSVEPEEKDLVDEIQKKVIELENKYY